MKTSQTGDGHEAHDTHHPAILEEPTERTDAKKDGTKLDQSEGLISGDLQLVERIEPNHGTYRWVDAPEDITLKIRKFTIVIATYIMLHTI